MVPSLLRGVDNSILHVQLFLLVRNDQRLDEPQVFTKLLTFVIAALPALGYAFERPEHTPNQFTRPTIRARVCCEYG